MAFKVIPGYNGLYSAHKCGFIINNKTGRYLKPYFNLKPKGNYVGRARVSLSFNGLSKPVFIHNLRCIHE